MKKLFTILLAVCFPLIVLAKPIDMPTAKKAGSSFLINHTQGLNFKNGDDLQLVYKVSSNATNANLDYFYVFNTSNSFVIVSADDQVTPILGYSNEGTFNPKNIAPQVAKWLEGYKDQIRNIIVNGVQANAYINSNWNSLVNNTPISAPQQASGSVSPLTKTSWNQSPYYNDLCPADNNGKHAVTGCVATAMAQVLKYWNYPTTGLDNHTYTDNTFGTQSANFAGTTYDWASMPTYNINSSNTAIATLMYHCGVSVDMNYGVDESSAYVLITQSPVKNCAEFALKNYFGYKSTLKGIVRKDYSDADWIKAIENEMDNSRPVIYAGFGSGGGHCFVCDGYDANDFMHFNWGWGGSYNGYFQIDALNPAGVGTGGGSGGFNSGQQAIIGIEPSTTNQGGGGSSSAYDLRLYDYVTASISGNATTTIGYGQAFTVSTNILNNGTNDFTGDYCAAIFDNNNTFIDYVQIISNASLPKGDVYQSDINFSYAGSYGLLPGTYTIGVYYRPTGGNWSLVTTTSAYTNYLQVQIINKGSLEMYSDMKVTPSGIITQGNSISVHLDVLNATTNDFLGDIIVGLYNYDGSGALRIQKMYNVSLPANYHFTNGLTFSASNISLAPGTYLLAATYIDTGSSNNYLLGSTNFANPIKITIQEPPITPDQYEPDDNISTAHNFNANYSNDEATISTNAANCHTGSDVDIYKINLATGYTYSIEAHIEDSKYTSGPTYTLDAVFSYSTDGGNSWSETFDDLMDNNISATSGTIYFKVAPYFAGQMGTYQFEATLTRTKLNSGIKNLSLETNGFRIFPNPANDVLNIDCQGISGEISQFTVLNMQGKEILIQKDIHQKALNTISLQSLPEGIYMLQIQSTEGVLNRKITVAR